MFRDWVFYLGYTTHGGSGLAWQPSEIMELDLQDIRAYLEKLSDQRDKEGKEIERAYKRK